MRRHSRSVERNRLHSSADSPSPDVESPAVVSQSSAALPALFHVLVICADEREQEQVYQEQVEKGRSCRVLTL